MKLGLVTQFESYYKMVDENGELVLLDNKGNVVRGDTKDLLALLRKNIIEEELRQEEEIRRKLEEEGLIFLKYCRSFSFFVI